MIIKSELLCVVQAVTGITRYQNELSHLVTACKCKLAGKDGLMVQHIRMLANGFAHLTYGTYFL